MTTADGVRGPAHPKRGLRYTEGLLWIVRMGAAERQHCVLRDPQFALESPQGPGQLPRRIGVVARRHRGVSGEYGPLPRRRQRIVERLTGL